MSLQVIVLVGLPGSGKTTFFRTHFAATHAHLSKDLWPNARRPEVRLQRELRAALEAGRSVVVDNVSASAATRAAIVGIAKEHGAEVLAYYFECDAKTAMERNATRIGRAQVPPVAILSAARDLERPLLFEGFDRLYVVRTLDGWTVHEYRR